MTLRRTMRFWGWLAGLITLAALLRHLGSHQFSLPHWDIESWKQWAEDTSPAIVVVSIARVTALAVTVYLVVATLLLALAHVLQIQLLIATVSYVAAPSVRAIVGRAVGVTLIATLVSPALAEATPALPFNAPTLVHIDPLSAPTTETTATTAPLALPTTTYIPEVPVPTPADSAPAAPALSGPSAHVVVAGENLWIIAQNALTQSLGHTPSQAQLAEYWDTVVTVNRDRLLSHSNANLIYAGQVIELP